MRSRRNQLPAADVISVSSIVDIDAPSEVTFPHLCDPHDQSEWKPVKFVIDQLRARADVRRRHGELAGAVEIVLSERLLKECMCCGDDGKKPDADR
jgi:hypothetical protein